MLQELGDSNSAYSLRSQLDLNVTFNEGSNKVTFKEISQFTEKLRNEWKVKITLFIYIFNFSIKIYFNVLKHFWTKKTIIKNLRILYFI